MSTSNDTVTEPEPEVPYPISERLHDLFCRKDISQDCPAYGGRGRRALSNHLDVYHEFAAKFYQKYGEDAGSDILSFLEEHRPSSID